MLDYGLSGRVVVVSGGTSGIGLASAIALARDGAHVAILGTNKTRMAEALTQVREAGGGKSRTIGITADVRNPNALAAAAIDTELGAVSEVIASAGIAGAFKAEDMTLEELNNILAINVGGVLSTCQAFVHGMFARKSGGIVIIGSINPERPRMIECRRVRMMCSILAGSRSSRRMASAGTRATSCERRLAVSPPIRYRRETHGPHAWRPRR